MRTITPLTLKREVYSDFTKDLFLHPVSYDLARKTNEESVKESIKNLIMIDKGERLMQPNIGSNVRKLLFENYMPGTTKIVENLITETIKAYEPRAELLGVSVIVSPDYHKANINIRFAVKMIEDPINFTIVVERIR